MDRPDDPNTARQGPPRKDSSSGFKTFAQLYRDAAPYLALGIQLAATVVIMFYVGKWADQTLGTAPWLMIAGLLLGAATGLYNFFRTVIDLGKKESKEPVEQHRKRC